MNLQGRRVLITAGGSGIGLAMAHVFTKAGASVFVTDINEAALKTLKSQLPQVHAVTADAGNEREVVRSVEQAVQALGDRKSTRLNSSHVKISYAVFCLKKKTNNS